MSELKPCRFCKGDGMVCEDHPSVAWGDGDSCCGGAGMPCHCWYVADNDRLKKELGSSIKAEARTFARSLGFSSRLGEATGYLSQVDLKDTYDMARLNSAISKFLKGK